MEFEKSPQTPAHYEPGEGCLTTVIRIPVRIVVLVVVIPVRMVWDVLVVCGRAVERVLLLPLGRALAWVFQNVLTPLALAATWLVAFIGKVLFVWPWVALWRYVVVPVVRYGLVVPLVWIYRQLLTPLGQGLAWLVERLLIALTPAAHGIAVVLAWLGRALFVWPWVGLWRFVVVPVVGYGLVVPLVWIYRQLLTPLGHGMVWLVVTLLVTPVVRLCRWVWRHILAPVGREIAAAIGVAWRIAGYISRAVGRAIKWLAWNVVGRPVRWFYQGVCTPVGHVVRDAVWHPVKKATVEAGRAARAALRSAGETVRAARRDAWRALIGGTRAPEPRKPLVRQARTLGSTTTVPGVAAESEVSLHKRG